MRYFIVKKISRAETHCYIGTLFEATKQGPELINQFSSVSYDRLLSSKVQIEGEYIDLGIFESMADYKGAIDKVCRK